MKQSITIRAVIMMTATLAGAPSVVLAQSAQGLAQRVQGVTNGTVRFSFRVRPDVCGQGNSVFMGSSNGTGSWGDRTSPDVEWESNCGRGPGRIVLDVHGGAVAGLKYYVGGRWRPRTDATDLGDVQPQVAADYLLALAQQLPGPVGKKAIFPATLADSVIVWPTLLKIARDEHLSSDTRRDAVFWLGQFAGAAATRNLAELVGEDTLDRSVREQAVFALSQSHNGDGVPELIKIAQTNRDPQIRRKAIFWLGQSRDPRALDFIEQVLVAAR